MEKPVSRIAFLKDVLTCSLGSYGGPEAHISVFLDILSVKRRYLTEEELMELVALCSILPGPTSTQTIVAVGHKIGGPQLALLTMLVWALPALIVMGTLSFMSQILGLFQVSQDVLRFIGPMAVGFIILAAFRIGKKVVVDPLSVSLMVLSLVVTLFIRSPWIFPLVLLTGGAISLLTSGEEDLFNRVTVRPPWIYLIMFIAIALILLVGTFAIDRRIIHLAESFYRYGYLVFGGGQVVVPVMHSELVGTHQYMTDMEFLTGYGLVQGLPGPMFSFAAYAGGMAARNKGWPVQVAGAIAGGMGIFLPGTLLIFFVYPVWEQLKRIRAIKVALKGIAAVAGGMIAAAAVVLLRTSGLEPINLAVSTISVILLASRKVPAPLIVLLALVAGILL